MFLYVDERKLRLSLLLMLLHGIIVGLLLATIVGEILSTRRRRWKAINCGGTLVNCRVDGKEVNDVGTCAIFELNMIISLLLILSSLQQAESS